MLAKMVPMELNITIDRALQVNPEFRSLYDGDARMHELIDMAKRLEGLPNHTSVHAAGVVIYPGDASNYVPLGRASDGTPTAEYNMVQLRGTWSFKDGFLRTPHAYRIKRCRQKCKGIPKASTLTSIISI